MTYDQARDREQLGTLEAAIGLFINRYLSNPPDPNRQTIILFPGGLGSRLVRADSPYQDGVPGQVFHYDTVWLDCSVLTGAALDLQMANDIDTEEKFVLADGYVDFPLMNIRPYNGFIQWCGQRNLDWFVFGWDWRRRPKHIVDFFLGTFLPTFRQRVQDACSADPLARCTLLGHSFGGMIVKLIMNEANPLVDQMHRAVTVATPFYGYAGQLHRYFEGDPELNFEGRSRVTRVVSSLPGGYVLQFLDKDTYDRDRIALAADANYPLHEYPSMDATNPAIVADAYNPTTKGTKVRYPKNYGFLPNELVVAKSAYQKVAEPLTPAANAKFFNVRGIQFRNGAAINETINSVTWDWIPKNFNPDALTSSPVVDEAVCPGDGVIPAWSARLVSTPQANVRTVEGDFEHMNIMNAEEIQNELANILGLPQMMAMRRGRRRTPRGRSNKAIADRKETLKFVRGLHAVRSRHRLASKLDQEQATRRYLAKYDISELRRFMGRAFVDALKSPSQKLGTAPTKTAPRPPSGGDRDDRSRNSAKTPKRKRKS